MHVPANAVERPKGFAWQFQIREGVVLSLYMPVCAVPRTLPLPKACLV